MTRTGRFRRRGRRPRRPARSMRHRPQRRPHVPFMGIGRHRSPPAPACRDGTALHKFRQPNQRFGPSLICRPRLPGRSPPVGTALCRPRPPGAEPFHLCRSGGIPFPVLFSIVSAALDLPGANCPPTADRTAESRPYTLFPPFFARRGRVSRPAVPRPRPPWAGPFHLCRSDGHWPPCLRGKPSDASAADPAAPRLPARFLKRAFPRTGRIRTLQARKNGVYYRQWKNERRTEV